MFSNACEYGIRAAIYIAGQSMDGKRVSLRAVAKEIGSPEAYTGKILQTLVRNGVINSDKGPTGGFSFDPQQLEVARLKHVVKAIDGAAIYQQCGLGLKQCNAKKPCPVHDQFKVIRDELNEMLDATTIKALSIELDSGKVFLKR